MKRKLLLSVLAVLPAALMPLASHAQVDSAASRGGEITEIQPKYEVYAGFGYTGLSQVNQSRYGLMGVDLAVTRDLGKYFGLTADGSYYKYAAGSSSLGNPGNPSVDQVLFGPVVHANIFGHFDGFVRGLIGGEHTGGEDMTPKVSFAGGFGGGMDYRLTPHLALRAAGDDIMSSFSLRNNSAQLGYSPHTTRSARATIGVLYKF